MDRPTTAIERDPQRIDEALAWYQNGTLSDDDRRWVESCLEADPKLRTRLAFDEDTAAGFDALLATVPADIGWAKLQQRIRADSASATRPDTTARAAGASSRSPASRDDSGSWASRLFDWFAGLMTPQLGAALAALVVIQTVGVGYLIGTRERPVEYRTLGDARPITVIRVLFDESVTERRLREGLTSQQATIVDGPNALGEYWIATRGDPVQVAKSLQAAGLVASFVIDQRVMSR
ncbi:MAG: hypothetical protein ABWZ78_06770 [Burkholderiaceae bacterium]